jgi:hypothetical protein
VLRRKVAILERMADGERDEEVPDVPEVPVIDIQDDSGHAIFLALSESVTLFVDAKVKLSRSQHERMLTDLLRSKATDFDDKAPHPGVPGRIQKGSAEMKLLLEKDLKTFLLKLVGVEDIAKVLRLLKVSPGTIKCCCGAQVNSHGGSSKIVKADPFVRHAASCLTFAARGLAQASITTHSAGRVAKSVGKDGQELVNKLAAFKPQPTARKPSPKPAEAAAPGPSPQEDTQRKAFLAHFAKRKREE